MSDPLSPVILAAIANSRVKRRMQKFTASGMWQRPPGVDFVKVIVVGAGGGGAEGNGNSGGGGGGGEITVREVQVTGDVPVTVGAGGTKGVYSNPQAGVAGGASSFGDVIARGGAGGIPNGTVGGGTGGGNKGNSGEFGIAGLFGGSSGGNGGGAGYPGGTVAGGGEGGKANGGGGGGGSFGRGGTGAGVRNVPGIDGKEGGGGCGGIMSTEIYSPYYYLASNGGNGFVVVMWEE